jgi:hypothetical protein
LPGAGIGATFGSMATAENGIQQTLRAIEILCSLRRRPHPFRRRAGDA